MRDRNYIHKRKWKSPLPSETTLGMALVKAIQNQRDELIRRHIDRTDWIDILRKGGKIKLSSAGAEIILPPEEEKPRRHVKRIYLGE